MRRQVKRLRNQSPHAQEHPGTGEVLVFVPHRIRKRRDSGKDLIWRIKRYQAAQETQSRYLRRRWLMASDAAGFLHAVYWAVSSAASSYDPGSTIGYSKALAREVIAEIRTDLDSFSDPEAAVLQNHGYFLADTAWLLAKSSRCCCRTSVAT